MNANASRGTKVLPIAKIPIKKTGIFKTSAEATGKSAAGRQPPSRFLNQYNDGAYASEKTSAVMISDAMVALLMSMTFQLPSITRNVTNRVKSPISQDAKEMQISFIRIEVRSQRSEVRSQFSDNTLTSDL